MTTSTGSRAQKPPVLALAASQSTDTAGQPSVSVQAGVIKPLISLGGPGWLLPSPLPPWRGSLVPNGTNGGG